MEFQLSRLRAGEWIIGAASLALLMLLFLIPWYGLPSTYTHSASALGAASSFSGWESLTVGRYLILLLGLGGLACWYVQGRCLAPALPVCAVVLETALGIVVVIGLYVRLIFLGPPVPLAHPDPAAFIGLVLAIGVVAGGYISMRQDQAPRPGQVVTIEKLRIGARAGGR